MSFNLVSLSFFTLLALSSTASASCGYGTTHHARAEAGAAVPISQFGYSGATGPTQWAFLSAAFETCSTGALQSPIDLTGNVTTPVSACSLNITLPTVEAAEFENLGSTIEVVMEGKGATMTVDGVEFSLKQFHYHTPSEHLVNGENFPLEMHMVFQAADNSTGVLATHFQVSATETTPLVQGLAAEVEAIKQPGTATEVGPLEFDAFLEKIKPQQLMKYTGSLTTPPCSEGIDFFVASERLPIDSESLNALKSVIGFNSRFPQSPPGEANVLASLVPNVNKCIGAAENATASTSANLRRSRRGLRR